MHKGSWSRPRAWLVVLPSGLTPAVTSRPRRVVREFKIGDSISPWRDRDRCFPYDSVAMGYHRERRCKRSNFPSIFLDSCLRLQTVNS